jgi:hypothetical protein
MTTPTQPVPTEPRASVPPPPTGDRPPPEERPRQVGLGVALIGAGTLWLLAIAGVPIRWEVLLPAAIVAIGVFLLVAGRRASTDGLVGLGIVLAVAAIVVTSSPGPVSVSAGERVHRATTTSELEPDYALGAGTMTLDLRELVLGGGVTEVAARVTFGELIVRVPTGVAVTGDAEVASGEIVAFDQTRSGLGPDLILDEPGPTDGPALDLDLEVGLGRIEVTR